jgi:hypothetical protein
MGVREVHEDWKTPDNKLQKNLKDPLFDIIALRSGIQEIVLHSDPEVGD